MNKDDDLKNDFTAATIPFRQRIIKAAKDPRDHGEETKMNANKLFPETWNPKFWKSKWDEE